MKDDKIEIRSENVRSFIGEMPSRMVRYGTTVISIVVLGLLIAICYIPYRETINARVLAINGSQVTLSISSKYI
jgi:hypothetical protein